ncbi:MAG: hypothetical protein JWO38_4265 [Gemmataceae bacterium]|nr:hypothetical protein [Gemmataceae bacterium]
MAFRLRIPLVETERTVFVGAVPLTLRGYQPVVWVQLVR